MEPNIGKKSFYSASSNGSEDINDLQKSASITADPTLASTFASAKKTTTTSAKKITDNHVTKGKNHAMRGSDKVVLFVVYCLTSLFIQ